MEPEPIYAWRPIKGTNGEDLDQTTVSGSTLFTDVLDQDLHCFHKMKEFL